MKKLFRNLLISTITLVSLSASADIFNEISANRSFEQKKNPLEKFSFNYFAKYTGPSLSDDYKDGATYNRFDGGVNQQGQKLDTTGSTQLYQSFKLGYKVGNGKVLAISHTFQSNLTNDVEYQWPDGAKGSRDNGQSNNNNRISLWIPNIFTGDTYSLSTSFFYEAPTTDSSKEDDLLYGIGIQPTLSINSKIDGLSHGLTASYERYVYPDDQFSVLPSWCSEPGYSCAGVTPNITRRQGVKANIGAYLNYALAEKLTLQSSVEFDWDQIGSQVATTQFGNNMDNSGKIGTKYQVTQNVTTEAFINFSIEEVSTRKSALGLSLDFKI